MTLQIHWPKGRSLGLALLFVLLFTALTEATARSAFVARWLPPPHLGSTHEALDLKIARLDAFAAQGPVDCVFVGSSVVDTGIDPRIVSDAVQAATGEPLRCFNFGITGASASEAADLAQMLVQRYAPERLVYANTMRDFSAQFGNPANTVEFAWMRYQLGERDPSGWLAEHSMAYQRFLTGVFWFVGGSAWDERIEREHRMTAVGFTPYDDVFDFEAAAAFAEGWGDNAQIDADDFAGLQRMASLPDVSLTLVEMPLSPPIVEAAPLGLTLYHEQMTAFSAERQISFLQPDTNIPLNGWRDEGHMNAVGAAAFSAALGELLADQ